MAREQHPGIPGHRRRHQAPPPLRAPATLVFTQRLRVPSPPTRPLQMRCTLSGTFSLTLLHPHLSFIGWLIIHPSELKPGVALGSFSWFLIYWLSRQHFLCAHMHGGRCIWMLLKSRTVVSVYQTKPRESEEDRDFFFEILFHPFCPSRAHDYLPASQPPGCNNKELCGLIKKKNKWSQDHVHFHLGWMSFLTFGVWLLEARSSSAEVWCSGYIYRLWSQTGLGLHASPSLFVGAPSSSLICDNGWMKGDNVCVDWHSAWTVSSQKMFTFLLHLHLLSLPTNNFNQTLYFLFFQSLGYLDRT